MSSPISKITYESKYCFLPFPVPDPFPPPAKGYFLLLTVLAGVEFPRNKCPIQSNAQAGLDGVLGQFVVPGEELEGKEQVRAGGNREGWWGGTPVTLFFDDTGMGSSLGKTQVTS